MMRMNMAENVRTFQTVSEHQGFIVQKLGHRPVGDNFTAIQDYSARAKLDREFKIVSCDQLGCRDLPEQRLEFAASPRIKITGGFIEDQHGRITGQNSR
jgi:hypothetical protein